MVHAQLFVYESFFMSINFKSWGIQKGMASIKRMN